MAERIDDVSLRKNRDIFAQSLVALSDWLNRPGFIGKQLHPVSLCVERIGADVALEQLQEIASIIHWAKESVPSISASRELAKKLLVELELLSSHFEHAEAAVRAVAVQLGGQFATRAANDICTEANRKSNGRLSRLAAEVRALSEGSPKTGGRRHIDWWLDKLAEFESEWADDSAITETAFAIKIGEKPNTLIKQFKSARKELARREKMKRELRDKKS